MAWIYKTLTHILEKKQTQTKRWDHYCLWYSFFYVVFHVNNLNFVFFVDNHTIYRKTTRSRYVARPTWVHFPGMCGSGCMGNDMCCCNIRTLQCGCMKYCPNVRVWSGYIVHIIAENSESSIYQYNHTRNNQNVQWAVMKIRDCSVCHCNLIKYLKINCY